MCKLDVVKIIHSYCFFFLKESLDQRDLQTQPDEQNIQIFAVL